MRMRLNLSKGRMGKLFICLGIVLIVAFLAGATATAPKVPQGPCPEEKCKKCVVVKGEKCVPIDPEYRCAAVCKISVGKGKRALVYNLYKKDCCEKAMHRWCTPQDPCSQDGCSKKQVLDDNCDKKVKSCGRWVQVAQKIGECPPIPKSG
jgi:hypothetical protein